VLGRPESRRNSAARREILAHVTSSPGHYFNQILRELSTKSPNVLQYHLKILLKTGKICKKRDEIALKYGKTTRKQSVTRYYASFLFKSSPKPEETRYLYDLDDRGSVEEE